MIITIIAIGILGVSIYSFLRMPVFGSLPAGDRKETIQQSIYYVEGKFRNLSPTFQIRPDANYGKMTMAFFKNRKLTKPEKPIDAVKEPLVFEKINEWGMVWFGHSSYLLSKDGIHVLVDPVFSGSASPIRGFGKAFKGADAYSAEDMPHIDFLIITHDHYDHLDYKTLKQLKNKIGVIITHFGVGAHLEKWGFRKEQILELEWNQSKRMSADLAFFSVPGRHFSGRQFKTAQSLWGGFILEYKNEKILIGGDSGYDNHFLEMANQYGKIDFAILECGQYGEDWPLIHMTPEEVVKASIDLNTRVVMPVHWGKFSLANHGWKEPVERFIQAAKDETFQIHIPQIGKITYPLIQPKIISWWKEQ